MNNAILVSTTSDRFKHLIGVDGLLEFSRDTAYFHKEVGHCFFSTSVIKKYSIKKNILTLNTLNSTYSFQVDGKIPTPPIRELAPHAEAVQEYLVRKGKFLAFLGTNVLGKIDIIVLDEPKTRAEISMIGTTLPAVRMLDGSIAVDVGMPVHEWDGCFYGLKIEKNLDKKVVSFEEFKRVGLFESFSNFMKGKTCFRDENKTFALLSDVRSFFNHL